MGWRITYVDEEMMTMQGMSKSQIGTARMIKAIRDQYDDLKSIKSYFIKNILIRMVNKDSDCLSSTMSLNLITFLSELRKYLKSKCLGHHKVSDLDLFQRLGHPALVTLYHKVHTLLNCKEEMYRIMKS